VYESRVQQPLYLRFCDCNFLSNILQSLCFLGLAEGLTSNLCSIISLVTPMRSEVLHAKTLMFLSKNESSSFSSPGVKCWDIVTVLSGTLGSSGTILISHSGSIGLLLKLPLFCLPVMLALSSVFPSCRKFTFLWPGAKPCSIFLASF
jgi:hypothetical protein